MFFIDHLSFTHNQGHIRIIWIVVENDIRSPKNFLLPTCEKFFPFIHRAFQKMVIPSSVGKPLHTHRFLTIQLPLCFVSKLEEYNAILGQQQIENIHYTLTLIDNKHNQEKIDALIKMNVQKSMQWCAKYDISHNIIILTNNVFMQT